MGLDLTTVPDFVRRGIFYYLEDKDVCNLAFVSKSHLIMISDFCRSKIKGYNEYEKITSVQKVNSKTFVQLFDPIKFIYSDIKHQLVTGEMSVDEKIVIGFADLQYINSVIKSDNIYTTYYSRNERRYCVKLNFEYDIPNACQVNGDLIVIQAPSEKEHRTIYSVNNLKNNTTLLQWEAIGSVMKGRWQFYDMDDQCVFWLPDNRLTMIFDLKNENKKIISCIGDHVKKIRCTLTDCAHGWIGEKRENKINLFDSKSLSKKEINIKNIFELQNIEDEMSRMNIISKDSVLINTQRNNLFVYNFEKNVLKPIAFRNNSNALGVTVFKNNIYILNGNTSKEEERGMFFQIVSIQDFSEKFSITYCSNDKFDRRYSFALNYSLKMSENTVVYFKNSSSDNHLLFETKQKKNNLINSKKNDNKEVMVEEIVEKDMGLDLAKIPYFVRWGIFDYLEDKDVCNLAFVSKSHLIMISDFCRSKIKGYNEYEKITSVQKVNSTTFVQLFNPIKFIYSDIKHQLSTGEMSVDKKIVSRFAGLEYINSVIKSDNIYTTFYSKDQSQQFVKLNFEYDIPDARQVDGDLIVIQVPSKKERMLGDWTIYGEEKIYCINKLKDNTTVLKLEVRGNRLSGRWRFYHMDDQCVFYCESTSVLAIFDLKNKNDEAISFYKGIVDERSVSPEDCAHGWICRRSMCGIDLFDCKSLSKKRIEIEDIFNLGNIPEEEKIVHVNIISKDSILIITRSRLVVYNFEKEEMRRMVFRDNDLSSVLGVTVFKNNIYILHRDKEEGIFFQIVSIKDFSEKFSITYCLSDRFDRFSDFKYSLKMSENTIMCLRSPLWLDYYRLDYYHFLFKNKQKKNDAINGKENENEKEKLKKIEKNENEERAVEKKVENDNEVLLVEKVVKEEAEKNENEERVVEKKVENDNEVLLVEKVVKEEAEKNENEERVVEKKVENDNEVLLVEKVVKEEAEKNENEERVVEKKVENDNEVLLVEKVVKEEAEKNENEERVVEKKVENDNEVLLVEKVVKEEAEKNENEERVVEKRVENDNEVLLVENVEKEEAKKNENKEEELVEEKIENVLTKKIIKKIDRNKLSKVSKKNVVGTVLLVVEIAGFCFGMVALFASLNYPMAHALLALSKVTLLGSGFWIGGAIVAIGITAKITYRQAA